MKSAGRVAVALAFLAASFTGGAYWRGATPASEPATSAAHQHDGQLWTCGMHPQVLQDHPGVCPICGMVLTPVRSAAPPTPGERTVRYWWDPMMNPPYIAAQPGKSPMGMDLVPVYADEVKAGTSITVDPVIVQNMGVRVAPVIEAPLRSTIRAVGILSEAQPNQHDINLRVSGWIQHLYADTEGMHVHAGAPLFDLYSPELQVATDELIAARRARERVASSGLPGQSGIYDAAVRKLTLLGVSDEQVRRLSQREQAPPAITFTSPVSGHLVEKMVVDGAAVKAGDRVLRIVDHSTLWLDAQIFEQQLASIRLGQRVTATVAAMPGEPFTGEILFVHPHVDPMTRAAMVRIALANPSLALRPNMYATVEITTELAPRTLVVPREAVIDSGTRQIAFVALDTGHFEPRQLTLGAEGDGVIEVRAGLAPGEQVVTSGQFLLDSESRLQEAIQKHLAQRLLSVEGGERVGGRASVRAESEARESYPAPRDRRPPFSEQSTLFPHTPPANVQRHGQ